MIFSVIYWVLCMVIGAGLAVWVWRRDRQSSHTFRWLPALLRGLSGFLIAALLLAPVLSFISNTTQKPLIIWLQDNSSSVAEGLGDAKEQFLVQKQALKDQLDDDYELVELQFGSDINKGSNTDFSEPVTNIEQALTHTFQRYKGSNLGAVILPSDGIYNEGADPVFALPQLETPVYAIALGDSTSPRDISVVRVFANKVVLTGNTFEVAADIRFSKMKDTEHQIHLFRNGALLQSRNVHIREEEETVSISFEVKAGSPGLIQYTIGVPLGPGEKSELNNKIDFYVQVVNNEVKVLVLNSGTHPDIGLIRSALKSTAGYHLEIAEPNTLPTDLSDYQSIIAFQPEFSQAQWQQIAAARLPVWHILGNQVSRAQVQQLEDIVKLDGGRSATFHSPVAQRGFAAFLLPVQAASVLAKLPPLESSASRSKAVYPNEVVLKSRESNADMWIVHSGTLPVAVTVGEGLWRWGIYEYRDNKSQLVTQELIRQTMRTLNVPRQDKPFQVFLSKRLLTDNENVAFTAELRNKTGQLVNDAEAQLSITDSAGSRKEFIMEQFGESYQIVLPKMGAGIYEYAGAVAFEGKNYMDNGTFAVENIPLEQINMQADYGLLYQLSHQTGGAFHTVENMNMISDEIKANRSVTSRIITENKKEPLIHYQWIFALLMLLFTGEWLFRKYNGMQ